jgi:Uma2 family endonuclease
MAARARTAATYDDLVRLPESLTGELIEGEIYAWPRPGGPHARFTSVVGAEINIPYDLGRGGPGGWWIIDEPELHFQRDRTVLVPEIGGWRRERMPELPHDHRFEIVPDWVLEVLSKSTARHDRATKLPIYAQYGVAYLWLADPVQRTVETYALENARWVLLATYGGDDKFRAEPFTAVEIDLGLIWGPTPSEDSSRS